MGYIVPPPPATMTHGEMVRFVGNRWACDYCRTVQAGDRVHCCNCGALRPGIEEMQRVAADLFAHPDRLFHRPRGKRP